MASDLIFIRVVLKFSISPSLFGLLSLINLSLLLLLAPASDPGFTLVKKPAGDYGNDDGYKECGAAIYAKHKR